MKLQIGMRVKIKNRTADYKTNAGKVKTITNHLPDFNDKRAFELDGEEGIWLVEDFDENVDYPNLPME